MVKILFAGLGNIGSKEISELSSDSKCEFVGAVDPASSRRQTVDTYNTYSNLESALEETNPDLVRIATPPHTHCELALQAINAGADVYIEKIMTTNVQEARRIVDTADENGCEVFVRRNAIYTPVYQRAWNALDTIGDVRRVQWIEPTGEYSDWSQSKAEWLRNLPGGIVSEHLPHALYCVRWFLSTEPTLIHAERFDMGVDIELKAGNQRATITYTEPTDLPMLLRIVGSDGIIDVNHSSFRISKPRGYEEYSIEGRTIRANAQDYVGSLKNISRLGGLALRRELNIAPNKNYTLSDNYRQFQDIITGKHEDKKFQIDGEEGVKNVEIFQSIWDYIENN